MAILSKEEFLSKIKVIVGEDTSDEMIQFVEDMADTYNDLETKGSSTDSTDWKAKHDELDKTWRKKYTDRFFGNDDSSNEDIEETEETDNEIESEEITIDDLFTEKE